MKLLPPSVRARLCCQQREGRITLCCPDVEHNSHFTCTNEWRSPEYLRTPPVSFLAHFPFTEMSETSPLYDGHCSLCSHTNYQITLCSWSHANTLTDRELRFNVRCMVCWGIERSSACMSGRLNKQMNKTL